MKVNKGWKEIYKNLSWYNRRKFIEVNRPFGKDPKGCLKVFIWLLAVLFIVTIVLILGR